MTHTHEQEKKQFQRLFRNQGVDQLDARFRVLEAFLTLEHHVTIDDIMDRVASAGDRMDRGFVLSTMELLCRFGFASKRQFNVNDIQYEHRHLGLHHDHMVCTKCGRILEFRDEAIEKLQLKLADAYGFLMLQHKMEIYGICSECLAKRSDVVPLHKAKTGEKLIVNSVISGKNMQVRLSSMGLKTGDMIEVVSSGFGGQVVIAAGDNRMVVGKGMAEKIMVQPFGPMKRAGHIEEDSQAEASLPPVKLSQMKTGQEGIIRKVSGRSILRRRLLEMGINRGTKIYVEKYAPLKDPIELVVKGYHISLRVEEAANILVDNVRFKQK
jgi:Fur family ferric uptake transcriptional regulator